MAPTTRSAGKPKSEEVLKQKSPKAKNSKKQAKKPAEKKAKKNEKVLDENLEVENGEMVEKESKEAPEEAEKASPKGNKRKADNKVPVKETSRKGANKKSKVESTEETQSDELSENTENDRKADKNVSAKVTSRKGTNKKSKVEGTEETQSDEVSENTEKDGKADKKVPAKVTSRKGTNKKPKAESMEDTQSDEVSENAENDFTTIYEFNVKDIDGNEVSLEKYKGHICIIVNVASRCGHTKSNYEQFVELHNKYNESKGLRILAFPCNQFGSQEPGTCDKIKEFAEKKGVGFDMFDKINVNGKNASPLWTFLKEKLPEVTSGKATGKDIKWNFTKFLINKDGVPVERYPSSTKPLTLVDSLEKLW